MNSGRRTWAASRSFAGGATAVLGLAFATSGCGSSGSSRAALVSIGAGLRGPAGVHAAVYMRGVKHMSAFAYDARGGLWIASSGATAHGDDGVFFVRRANAAPVKVIRRIRGPLGLQWVGGSLYVSSLDGVTKFSGLTAAGRFTRRTAVLIGPVAGAENNNLVLAPNGRLVMGVSAICDHCASTPRFSGAVISFRTDGSDLKVLARRVRAVYGLVYDGNVLYATLNQRDDLGTRTPGDLLAVIERGQDWRFPACFAQGGSACRGVPSPVATLDAHAAAGGVAVVDHTAVVAEWNTGKVLAISLRADRGTKRTLVTGIVHPLPVLGSRDGAVLVGDWASGTVYRISGAIASS